MWEAVFGKHDLESKPLIMITLLLVTVIQISRITIIISDNHIFRGPKAASTTATIWDPFK